MSIIAPHGGMSLSTGGLQWVKSTVFTVNRSHPVYPDQRTFLAFVGMSQRCTTADLRAVLRFVYSSGVRPRLAHPKARMSTFCSISRLTNGTVIVLGAVLGAWPIGFLHQPQFAPLVSGLVMDGGVDIGNEQTPKSWPLSQSRLEQDRKSVV